jgi:integrase
MRPNGARLGYVVRVLDDEVWIVDAEGVEVGTPKTKAGERVISIDAETAAAISAWRKTQAAERLLVGAGWRDHGLVFVDPVGAPPHPETVTRWWREAVATAGVQPIRLHDARHTAATIMLRSGVPVKVVTQRLGHADVCRDHARVPVRHGARRRRCGRCTRACSGWFVTTT